MPDFTKISKIFAEHEGILPPKEVLVQLFYDYFLQQLNPQHPFWNQPQTPENAVINRIVTALAAPLVIAKDTNADYVTDLKMVESISQCFALFAILPALQESLQAFLECYPYLIPNVEMNFSHLIDMDDYKEHSAIGNARELISNLLATSPLGKYPPGML
jgi:hypothetical protein